MAEQSSMIPLGTKAPSFLLLNTVTQQWVSLEELASPTATVIMFLCNHCPYVKYIQPKLVQLAQYYSAKGIHFIAISSNDVNTYPEDGPEAMKIEAEANHYPFPYLYDETQEIAKAYYAACTPEFYIFDKNLLCVYRGRFDDSTPRNQKEVTGKDLSYALDQLLANQPINEDQKPSIGCGIKWKNT